MRRVLREQRQQEQRLRQFLNGNAVSNTIDSNIVVLHGRILQFKIELN